MREVRGEMVQVELFRELALAKTANHKAHVRLHLLSSLADAERQTACYFPEEAASFVLRMHAIRKASGIIGSMESLVLRNLR